jgi:hypothetical protein
MAPDLLELLGHVPENLVNRLCEHFRFSAKPHPKYDSEDAVCALGRGVAAFYPGVVKLVGEPRALAVFGSISGILQKVPVGAKLSPMRAYIAACFYLGWELVGSYELTGPEALIRQASRGKSMQRSTSELGRRKRSDLA